LSGALAVAPAITGGPRPLIRGDNHELWSSARDACGVTDSVRPDIRRMVSARMERRRNKRMHTVNWDLYRFRWVLLRWMKSFR